MARTQTKKLVPGLTGIRFFAAAYVFVFHYGATAIDKAGVPRPVATFLHNGIFGVSVFFILSGFILAHAHPTPFTTGRQYAVYFLHRFARIYPLYLFALIVALPVAVDDVPLDLRHAVAVLAMVQSWTDAFAHSGYAWIMQAWTLSIELAFYLSFPFLIVTLRRIGTPLLLGLCALDASFIICGGTTTVTPWTDYGGYIHQPVWPLYLPLPLVRAGEFLLGMLLHTAFTRLQQLAPKPRAAHCLLVAAAIAGLLSATTNERTLGAAAVLVGILIAMIYISDSAFTHLLGNRVLVLLGNASYALYLLQWPVHAYLVKFVPAPYDRLLAFPAALAAAILAWRFVETPARRHLLNVAHWQRESTQILPQTNQGAIPMRREP